MGCFGMVSRMGGRERENESEPKHRGVQHASSSTPVSLKVRVAIDASPRIAHHPQALLPVRPAIDVITGMTSTPPTLATRRMAETLVYKICAPPLQET